MDRRIAHRWHFVVALLIGSFFALGSFWLLQLFNQNGADLASLQNRNEADYFADNFSVVRMDKHGVPSYIVSGVKLTHLPYSDASEIEHPFVRDFTPGQQPLNIHALRGRVDQNNSRVQLFDNVLIERAAGPQVAAMSLKTEALTVLPDLDRMETALPVTLLQGRSILTGIGMKANNATHQVDIAQQLHITYPPVHP